MPLFACSKCETVDNTALGDFWHRQVENLPPLCSGCGQQGEWHGQFPRRKADSTCLVNASGHLIFKHEAGQFKRRGPWKPYQPKEAAP